MSASTPLTIDPLGSARNSRVPVGSFGDVRHISADFRAARDVADIAAIYFRIPWLAIGGGVTLAFALFLDRLILLLEREPGVPPRALAGFAGGPVIITIVYFMLLGFEVPYVVQFVLFFWNTIHVSRQNCGILSIYRNKAGVGIPAWRSGVPPIASSRSACSSRSN
jgi:hypothetical protein